MLKAYSVRLLPTAEQERFFQKSFGAVRFLYNHFLETSQHGMDQIKKRTPKRIAENTLTVMKTLDEFAWLNELDSTSLQRAIRQLDEAWKKFFKQPKIHYNEKKVKKAARRGRKLTPFDLEGHPQFKSKKDRNQSYTAVCNYSKKGVATIYVQDRFLRMPKVDFVKFIKSKEIKGHIISVTIRSTSTDKYYASILVDTDIAVLRPKKANVGIDVGLKDFAILSNGVKIANPKHLRRFEKKMAYWQRKLSRRKKGGRNKEKARLKVAQLHERIHNAREDFLHKVSTRLIRDNQVIVVEDLRVKNMLQNHKLAKSVADASWSRFVKMLEYKTIWYGRTLVYVDPWFPSSQLCSDCGFKNPAVKDLKIREWDCLNCGEHHDRDQNAATNLLIDGIKILEGLTALDPTVGHTGLVWSRKDTEILRSQLADSRLVKA